MKTVHLIFNAHIDPVWLWPWQAGLDTVLATCHSACDRLDNHPELIFTRGEAWAYEQVQKLDPALFERIRKHAAAGRWEIVGGWYIQPDCNLPSGFGMEQQIEIGKRYFIERFGAFPRIACNVDSFGHAATLPGILRKMGQDRYIYMRPQDHELDMPHRLFRWRGYDQGPEVVAFHIAGSYCTSTIDEGHIRRALAGLPEGIDDTMCFVGVGDHGGGPTEKMIAWCKEHQSAFDGVRLAFSSPARYFAAVEKKLPQLPLVTGELQYHAIGCYTAYRPVKVHLRRAEHRLHQGGQAMKIDPEPDAGDAARLAEGWRWTVFNHFHDTLGGTCIPSAYGQVLAQLGLAEATGDQIVQTALRRKMRQLAPDAMQQIVFHNASDQVFEGYTSCEPWREWRAWDTAWRLIDELGNSLPCQALAQEAVTGRFNRLLMRLRLEPNEVRALRIDETPGQAATVDKPVCASMSQLANHEVTLAMDERQMRIGGKALGLPRLDLIEDLSDTWSHGIDRYGEGPLANPRWKAPILTEAGPLMASIHQSGTIGGSALSANWRVYAGEPYAELLLRVTWVERFKILKMTIGLPDAATRRVDGIMGGQLQRPCNGQERPLRDWTLVELAGGVKLGLVCPDVYALDGDAHRLRLTLLRSPIMAHHDPTKIIPPHGIVGDHGVHEFRFRFFAGSGITETRLEREAMMVHRPLTTADLTRGMTGEW